MPNDENDGPPDTPDTSDTPEASGDDAGGKLIGESVFLSRLAARQEALNDARGRAEAISTLEEAFRALGIIPGSPLTAAIASPPSGAPSGEEAKVELAAEDVAVENLLLSELRAGKRPQLSDYLQRYPNQRAALLRLATQLDPRELAGSATSDAMTPEAQAAADLGLRAGELRALRILANDAAPAKRRRGRRAAGVAEEPGQYGASPTGGEQETPRARPDRPEDSGPEH